MDGIIIDWLTFSTRMHSLLNIYDLLGVDPECFTTLRGNYGYTQRLYYEHISILYGGRDDMGICVEISGQGCRYLESVGITWNDLFTEILSNSSEMNISRLDVAFDDTSGKLLPMDKIFTDSSVHNYVSKLRTFDVHYSSSGKSVTFGSRSSRVLIRIYDKKAEQQSKGLPCDFDSWVRCELQLMDENAFNFIELLSNGVTIGSIYYGVLQNYHRFIDPDSADRRDRCRSRPYWTRFLNAVEKISIGIHIDTLNSSLVSLDRYILGQARYALKCWVEIHGGVQSLESRLSQVNFKPGSKYINLIGEWHDYTKTHTIEELLGDV